MLLVTQSCLTLCDPMDSSLPGCSSHGIFQTRIVEWVAISYTPEDLPNPGIEPTSLTYPALAGRFFTTSATWEALQRQPACVLSCFSHVWLFVTLWMVAHQAPLSRVFSRQEYWSGLLCPPPGDLPDPGIKPVSLMSPALAGRFFTISTTWEAVCDCVCVCTQSSQWHQQVRYSVFMKQRLRSEVWCKKANW